MDWSTMWQKVVAVAVPILLIFVVPYVIAYIKAKIALVKDERLRAMLLEIVAAVEKMIPKAADAGNALENAAKLDLAQKIVMQETGKTVPDYKIAAAVTALKGAVK